MKKRFITSKMITDFEVELSNDEKSDNTIEKYLRDIKCFLKFVDDRLVEKALVLEYKAKLENR